MYPSRRAGLLWSIFQLDGSTLRDRLRARGVVLRWLPGIGRQGAIGEAVGSALLLFLFDSWLFLVCLDDVEGKGGEGNGQEMEPREEAAWS